MIALLASCCACGRPEWPGDPELHGAKLEVEKGAESYVSAPDFKARLARIIAQAAVYEGHDPAELAGVRILIKAGRFQCGGIDSVGCYSDKDNTIRFAAPSICIENSVLPHELVHYFFGDHDHRRQEFRLWYFKPLWSAIHDGSGGECERYKDLYSGQWAGPELKP